MAAGATRVGWGAKLSGHEFDLADWKEALKQPFDPRVMQTGNGTILRSSQLDSATTSSDACERAKIHHNAGIVRVETIEEIMSDGRRNVFVQVVGTAKARSRVGAVGVAIGPGDKPAPPPPPEPSNAQRWLSIAADDELLADTLTFFGRSDNWFDVYKALECLIGRFGIGRIGGGKEDEFLARGWAPKTKIGLLKRTADFWRNSPRGRPKVVPPPNPMELTEARDRLAKLMARAFQEAARADAAKPPRSA